MKVCINGEKREIPYAEICKELGFVPDVRFVKVTHHGTISFTCGKPDEIRALKAAVSRAGMVAAKKLRDISV